MKSLIASHSMRWLLPFALAVFCLSLFAAGALAAEAPVVASASLQANFLLELVADRARLIQVSLVMVAAGIWLLWWRH
jgi:hypothetical protein